MTSDPPGRPTEHRPTGSLQPSLKVTSGNKSLVFLMGFLKEKQRGFSINIFFCFFWMNFVTDSGVLIWLWNDAGSISPFPRMDGSPWSSKMLQRGCISNLKNLFKERITWHNLDIWPNKYTSSWIVSFLDQRWSKKQVRNSPTHLVPHLPNPIIFTGDDALRRLRRLRRLSAPTLPTLRRPSARPGSRAWRQGDR